MAQQVSETGNVDAFQAAIDRFISEETCSEAQNGDAKDLPDIKYEFELKWFLYEKDIKRDRGPKMPQTRFYHIPGFPGLQYGLLIQARGCEENSDEDELLDEDALYDSLRVILAPMNSNYKNYKVIAEWYESHRPLLERKRTRVLTDVVRHFDKKVTLTFPEADNLPGFISVQGTFILKKLYFKDIEIENIPADYLNLHGDENGKDFTLVAGKTDIKVHKRVLGHSSPVFSAVFDGNEWKENAERKYAIPDFSHKVVQIAVNAIYGLIYDEKLSKEEYISLFTFADKYQMDDLKLAVKESVILTPHNICEYLNLCHSKKCEELFHHCLDYFLIFLQNGYDIVNKDSLLLEVKLLYADRSMNKPTTYSEVPDNKYFSYRDESEDITADNELDIMNMLCSDYN